MRKTGRKRGKLAVQISLIVAAIMLILLYTIGVIVFHSTKNMYIRSYDDQIRNELEECGNLFMKPEIVGWALDQWQLDPETVSGNISRLVSKEDSLTQQDYQMLHSLQAFMTAEEIRALPSEERKAFVTAMYLNMVHAFEEKRAAGRFDSVRVIDIRNDDELYDQDRDDYYVILECSARTDGRGDHGLGTYISKDDTNLPVQRMQHGIYGRDFGDIVFQERSSRRDNTLKYTAAAPFFADGKIRYVICLEYNWSSFAELLDVSLDTMSLSGLLSVLAAAVLLYLFIYFRTIRPLVQVNSGVLAYMRDKDSGAAGESMAKVRVRNETAPWRIMWRP